MLSEAMADDLPETPMPEKLEAWYHSEVTQWFIANLTQRLINTLELMAETATGNPSADFQEMTKLQGDYEATLSLIEELESYRNAIGVEDV